MLRSAALGLFVCTLLSGCPAPAPIGDACLTAADCRDGYTCTGGRCTLAMDAFTALRDQGMPIPRDTSIDDAGRDAVVDLDVGMDAAADFDTGMDATADLDVGADAGSDAATVVDAGMDVGMDAALDIDVGNDAGTDAYVQPCRDHHDVLVGGICYRGTCSSTPPVIVACAPFHSCTRGGDCACADPSICGRICATNTDCSSFERCDTMIGACRPDACWYDAGCLAGEFCEFTTTGGHCHTIGLAAPGSPCLADHDCTSRACVGGTCGAGCDVNGDCASGRSCEERRGPWSSGAIQGLSSVCVTTATCPMPCTDPGRACLRGSGAFAICDGGGAPCERGSDCTAGFACMMSLGVGRCNGGGGCRDDELKIMPVSGLSCTNGLACDPAAPVCPTGSTCSVVDSVLDAWACTSPG